MELYRESGKSIVAIATEAARCRRDRDAVHLPPMTPARAPWLSAAVRAVLRLVLGAIGRELDATGYVRALR